MKKIFYETAKSFHFSSSATLRAGGRSENLRVHVIIIIGLLKGQVCFFFWLKLERYLHPIHPQFLRPCNYLLNLLDLVFIVAKWGFDFICQKCLVILHTLLQNFKTFFVKYQQLFCVTNNIPTLKAKEKSCNSSYFTCIQ